MDRALSRKESKELMTLLGLPMSFYGHLPVMRKAFIKKSKEYHPDKGGDEDKCKRLTCLYRKLEDNVKKHRDFDDLWGGAGPSWRSADIPPYGTPDWDQWWDAFNKDWGSEEDLHCNETLDPSDDESTQDTQESTPPKKKRKFDFPESVIKFLSKAIVSNKTYDKFAIGTNIEKSCSLYKKILDKYNVLFISRHQHEDIVIILLLTGSKHRTSAIENFCMKFCTYSFVCCRAVLNDKEMYEVMCEEPFQKIEESVEGGLFNDDEKEPSVSWVKIQEYALENEIEDVLLLMGLYLDLAKPLSNCMACLEEKILTHCRFHKQHYENAKLFKESRSQKNICQQAVDGVLAARRVQLVNMKREDLLCLRFKKILSKMEILFGAKGNGDLKIYLAGAAWLHCLLPKFEETVYDIIKAFTLNAPKKRYYLFQGPLNSGKTTLAAALLDLLGGKALNINIPKEKLGFELGMAIDQFMVVFEDVKGDKSAEDHELPRGFGMGNLDDLRDYLDGCVPVNLEKKHLNKRSQVFPPGIVTSNHYEIPLTLRCRFVRILHFRKKIYLEKSLQNSSYLLYNRILQSGVTLLLLLIYHLPVEEFEVDLQEKVIMWKQRIDEDVGDHLYRTFLARVAQGIDIRYGDVEEEDERSTQSSEAMPSDSGVGSAPSTQEITQQNPE
ncbi:large T antigen [Betapolyomavirus lepweddellii]|uniref:Large T antigen n=1 Tax=Betapolyomavirus lepweddellii TaxID=1925019 RepID=A0A1L4AB40_9POLY|nr:large T antigen [Betapolyomavirus lepweddellii]API65509.1 large T antigen [Betapolyomavirus lepweddellii]